MYIIIWYDILGNAFIQKKDKGGKIDFFESETLAFIDAERTLESWPNDEIYNKYAIFASINTQ